VVNQWTDHINAGKDIDVLYLDLQKALIKVPHECLIHKLGVEVNWIKYFISDCRQRVCVRRDLHLPGPL